MGAGAQPLQHAFEPRGGACASTSAAGRACSASDWSSARLRANTWLRTFASPFGTYSWGQSFSASVYGDLVKRTRAGGHAKASSPHVRTLAGRPRPRSRARQAGRQGEAHPDEPRLDPRRRTPSSPPTQISLFMYATAPMPIASSEPREPSGRPVLMSSRWHESRRCLITF